MRFQSELLTRNGSPLELVQSTAPPKGLFPVFRQFISITCSPLALFLSPPLFFSLIITYSACSLSYPTWSILGLSSSIVNNSSCALIFFGCIRKDPPPPREEPLLLYWG